jgi:hypothetical protein
MMEVEDFPTPSTAAAAAAQATTKPSDPVVTGVHVTGSRVVDPPEFYVRAYTVYSIVCTTEGSAAAPIPSERRFSEIAAFHDAWVQPLMSLDVPVELPSTEAPVDFARKNEADVVAERKIAIQAWANSALAVSRRIGSQVFTTALQLFLRGFPSPGPAEAAVMRMAWEPPTSTWDPAGAWVFHTAVDFGGETYTVPHRLELSPDGVTAAFRAEGHPQSGGIVCSGTGASCFLPHFFFIISLSHVCSYFAHFR